MLISIIIPVFNRETLIVEALESVVKQKQRPVEVIVVDDGSNDGSAVAAESFAKKNAQAGLSIRIIRKENAGSTKARNAGIQAATGEALLFLDSDDVLCPLGLEQLAVALNHSSKPDFVYGKVQLANEDLDESGECVGLKADNLLDDPVTYHWHTMAALYRKALVAKSGGWDERSDGSDDWVFQARIKLAAQKAAFVDTTVGIWRQHPGDRLGATSFQESYTVDVTKSCLSIFQLWSANNLIDASIRRRLYLRTLRHCWELGRSGSKAEKQKALIRLSEIGQGSKLLRILTHCVMILPSFCDRFLFSAVEKFGYS